MIFIPTRTLIAIPCLDMVPVNFMTSLLNLRKPSDTSYAVNANSLIYDSRNQFAANALMKNYDRVLWLDSDMSFPPDLLESLSADMDTGLDYVAGIYFKRKHPVAPVVYHDITYQQNEDGTIRADAFPYYDYPHNTLFEVAGTGFGAVLTSTRLLKSVWEKFGPPFDPLTQMGEDLSFCYRARQLGFKMYCDSRVKIGHIGTIEYNEQMYFASRTTPERS